MRIRSTLELERSIITSTINTRCVACISSAPGSGTFVDDPRHQINPLWLTVQYARSQVGSAGWTYVPNSKWVNSFRFGYSHYYQTFNSGDGGGDPANYSFNGSTYQFYTGQTNKAYFGLPRIRIGELPSFQLGASWPKTVGPDSVWQFSDSVSYLRGNHSFKFGGEVLVNQSTNNVTANTKGPSISATWGISSPATSKAPISAPGISCGICKARGSRRSCKMTGASPQDSP